MSHYDQRSGGSVINGDVDLGNSTRTFNVLTSCEAGLEINGSIFGSFTGSGG